MIHATSITKPHIDTHAAQNWQNPRLQKRETRKRGCTFNDKCLLILAVSSDLLILLYNVHMHKNRGHTMAQIFV